MGNCLSKHDNEPFTLYAPPLTWGYTKKSVSSIEKNCVKYVAINISDVIDSWEFQK